MKLCHFWRNFTADDVCVHVGRFRSSVGSG